MIPGTRNATLNKTRHSEAIELFHHDVDRQRGCKKDDKEKLDKTHVASHEEVFHSPSRI